MLLVLVSSFLLEDQGKQGIQSIPYLIHLSLKIRQLRLGLFFGPLRLHVDHLHLNLSLLQELILFFHWLMD